MSKKAVPCAVIAVRRSCQAGRQIAIMPPMASAPAAMTSGEPMTAGPVVVRNSTKATSATQKAG